VRFGTVVYRNEVIEMKQRLKAAGIVLVVIKGKRNIDDVEFSSIIEGEAWIKFTAAAMAQTAMEMFRNVDNFKPEKKTL
jgi:vacuolar-type H+-ATPase subunit D/Vma8